MHERGRLKRMIRTFAAGDEDLRAAELQHSVERLGATPVADCNGGRVVSVAGTLRTVTLRPRAGVPALEAELWDGTGTVSLVWLGRRRIVGIEPGRRLMAQGRLCTTAGRTAIYNPTYDLLPSAG